MLFMSFTVLYYAWSELLPSAIMAFQMTPGVQTTGYSPYRILLRKEMTLPVDISLLPQEPITQAPKEFVDVVLKKIKITRETAYEPYVLCNMVPPI
jgi:hypothetical protein